MAACGMAKPVKVLFDLVCLDRVLDSFADRESALAFLGKPEHVACGARGWRWLSPNRPRFGPLTKAPECDRLAYGNP